MASQPAIIVLMGPTGSGKSNFINRLTQGNEDGAARGRKPHMQSVREYTVNLSSNRQYVFVDTPGFDVTYQSIQDILRTTADWLKKKYGKSFQPTGIIYMHPITDDRMPGPACKNLDILGGLRTDAKAECLRLVTTMWDIVKDANLAESKVSQLETNFWRPLIDAGARHERFDNSSSSAWEIVQGLTGDKETVLIQAERMLNETTAVKDKNLHEQKETIKKFQEKAMALDDPELVKQLEAEQRRLEAELHKTPDYDMDNLKVSSYRRATLLFAKRTQTISREIKRRQFGQLPEVAKNDYVIFMVGPAGAGKSWFTGQLFKNHDSHNVASNLGTKEVKAMRCHVSAGLDDIVVVDVPSFRTDGNDFDAESVVTKWLNSKFIKKCHPGIMFLHSVDSNPAHDHLLMSRHLETFAKAFLNAFTVPSRVYVVPTSNPASTFPKERLSQRLLQLKTVVGALNGNGKHKWRASMFPGVFEGQPEAAWTAVLLLLKSIADTEANFSDAYIALEDLAHSVFEGPEEGEIDGDLGAKIMLGQTALEFTPLEHRRRHSILIKLANLLYERFRREDKVVDLDEVIKLRRTASDCLPQSDPGRPAILLELDNSLYQRFRKKGALVDLEEITSLRRVVLEYTPTPDRCKPLLRLAQSLYEKYQQLGSVDDMEEAHSLACTASQLRPSGHPDLMLYQELRANLIKAKMWTEIDPSSSASSAVNQLVKESFFKKVGAFPLRLLHTRTGVLCNRDAQLSHFMGSRRYSQLLSSIFSLNNQRIEKEVTDAVSEFFEFAMLSHRWGISEPLLGDIEGEGIYDLGGTDGLAKLQNFCLLACEHSFQWAWSDTCCIDTDSSAELQEAIGSMFSWYRQSSLTIVHLSDVSDTGSLANSVWFKRGWTLQELLASRTILFYTHDWSLYMNCAATNHKTDPTLIEELQQATGIAKRQLTNFYPGADDARSKLQWASRRCTTRPEDIAYSLFAIFNVHLPIFYGERAVNALGRLLAEIILQSGDTSILDWVGEASSFHSCFPASLVPYQTVPHTQLIPSDPAQKNGLDLEKARKLYDDLARLPHALFFHPVLVLPSIIHPVTAVKLQESLTSPSRYTYEIHASRLRPIAVTISVNLDYNVGRYIFVRPLHPKSLETQTDSGEYAVWNLLEQLEQPFDALLLESLPHNKYRRIASDCAITVYVRDLASILDSEARILDIV